MKNEENIYQDTINTLETMCDKYFINKCLLKSNMKGLISLISLISYCIECA